MAYKKKAGILKRPYNKQKKVNFSPYNFIKIEDAGMVKVANESLDPAHKKNL